MSGVGNKFYWRGDEETASIYRPDGKIIATVCKRDSSDECASTRAIEVTTALNNNHFSRVKPLEWSETMSDERVRRGVEWFDANFNGIPYSEALVRGILEVARPRVKKLVWRQIGPDGSDVEAETPIGRYTLSFGALSAGGDVNLWMAGANDDTFTTFYDRAEAKAAAQSDYERRILSALE